MIFEELIEEINQRSNKLTIDYVASLFVSGSKNLENQDWFVDFDNESLVKSYITALGSYIRCKVRYKRYIRDHNSSITDQGNHSSVISLREATIKKLRLRHLLSLRGVNYEKYHTPKLL